MISKFEKMIKLIPNHAARVSTVRRAEAQEGREEHQHCQADLGAPGPGLEGRRGLRASGGQEGGGQQCKEARGTVCLAECP